MTKKQKVAPERVVTKHQLSKWQQQRRRQHLILGVGVLVIAAAIGIVGYGYYDTKVKPFNEPAIKVNDTTFDMGYFIEMLRLYGKGQDPYRVYEMADQVMTAIERDEVIRQGSSSLGIKVDPKEIEEELEERDLPSDRIYRDLIEAQLLLDKLREEQFDPLIPSEEKHANVEALLLEDSEGALDVKARLEAGEELSQIAEDLSLDSISKRKGGELGWLPPGILGSMFNSPVLDETAFDHELELGVWKPIVDEAVRKSLGYWLIDVLEREEEQVHIQVMLLGNKGKAEATRARLEAGGDFAEIARELSQDDASRENGGDMGWISPDNMRPALKEAVSSLELNTLSEPLLDEAVITTGGCWLLKVLGWEVRDIESDYRSALKGEALNEWFLEQRETSLIERYLDDEKKFWAIGQALG